MNNTDTNARYLKYKWGQACPKVPSERPLPRIQTETGPSIWVVPTGTASNNVPSDSSDDHLQERLSFHKNTKELTLVLYNRSVAPGPPSKNKFDAWCAEEQATMERRIALVQAKSDASALGAPNTQDEQSAMAET